MKLPALLLAGLLVMAFTETASAQNQNFYNRSSIGYDPIIDVVTSGAQVLVQPVVSHDRKYVTLSMQPQISQLVDLATFPVAFQQGGGLVGGVVPAPVQPGQSADINESRPVQINLPRGGSILNQPGMTRLE